MSIPTGIETQLTDFQLTAVIHLTTRTFNVTTSDILKW